MKHTNIHTDNDEQLLSDLFSSLELEEPSADFTKNIIDSVSAQTAHVPIIEVKKKNKLKTNIIYALTSCFVILLSLWIVQSDINVGDMHGMNVLVGTFKYIINIFASTFSKIPPLAFIILMACGTLYFIDKTFSKFTVSEYKH